MSETTKRFLEAVCYGVDAREALVAETAQTFFAVMTLFGQSASKDPSSQTRYHEDDTIIEPTKAWGNYEYASHHLEQRDTHLVVTMYSSGTCEVYMAGDHLKSDDPSPENSIKVSFSMDKMDAGGTVAKIIGIIQEHDPHNLGRALENVLQRYWINEMGNASDKGPGSYRSAGPA